MKVLENVPTAIVKKKYVKWGARFGDMLSYLYMGRSVGFEAAFRKWKNWEAEYARRGFRTISTDDFISYGGGYVKTLNGFDEMRAPGEELILHAKIYEDRFLGREQDLVH